MQSASRYLHVFSFPHFIGVLAMLLFVIGCPRTAFPQPSAFAYQGRLAAGGAAANGIYDLRFAIYDLAANGSVIAGPLTNASVGVTNGLFATSIDFGGNVFTGTNAWLEVAARTNGASVFTTLTPRQQILSVPYASYAGSAASATVAVSANAVSATNISGGLSLAQLPAAVLTNGAAGVSVSGTFTGNGGGLTNLPGLFVWQTVSGAGIQAAANTGYIVTNNTSPVTITLPPAPNFGDIVRVSGVGSGGWQIAQNGGQSIVAGSLAGSTALTGIYWTPRDAVRNWTSVACSADGTKLAATAGGAIYTSVDSGVTWIPQNVTINGGGAFGPQLAMSADGTKIFALTTANTNQLYVSMDSGLTWTTRNVASQASYFQQMVDNVSLACSADGTHLVAVDYGGATGDVGFVFVSTNSGATWTTSQYLTDETVSFWFSAACSADGAKIVAVDSYYGGALYTSPDAGTTWILQTNFPVQQVPFAHVASSADGTKLAVAVLGNFIYTSADSGVTWALQTNGLPSGGASWWSIASSADGTKLVATIGFEPGYTAYGRIYVSTNSGASWTARGVSVDGMSSASSADGTKLAVAAYGNHLYTTGAVPVASTTAGTSGYLTGGQNTAVELQYIGNGQWQPLSHEGNIYGH